MSVHDTTGWAVVATKLDLDLTARALRAELQAEIRRELSAQTRTIIHAMIFSSTGTILAVTGLAFAAARLV